MKLVRGIVKQNGTRMQMNNWKKECSTLYTNVSVPFSMLLSLIFFSVVLTKRITLFDNQELLKSVIISFILMTFKFDSRLIK